MSTTARFIRRRRRCWMRFWRRRGRRPRPRRRRRPRLKPSAASRPHASHRHGGEAIMGERGGSDFRGAAALACGICACGIAAYCFRRCFRWCAVLVVFAVAVCDYDGARAQGAGADSESLWAEPRGAVRIFAADGGWDQVADQGRYCAACGGQGGAFSGAGGAGAGGVSRFMRCCRSGAIWCWRIWMPGCCSFLRWVGDGVGGVYGGVVEPQQVFAAGRDARDGADDQL